MEIARNQKIPALLDKLFPKEPGTQIREAPKNLHRGASPDASGLTVKSITVRLWEGNTEAVVVVPVVRVVVVPVDRADVNGSVVIVPAAYHAVRPRGSAPVIQYCENRGIAQGADGQLPIPYGGPLPFRKIVLL